MREAAGRAIFVWANGSTFSVRVRTNGPVPEGSSRGKLRSQWVPDEARRNHSVSRAANGEEFEESRSRSHSGGPERLPLTGSNREYLARGCAWL